MIMVASMPKALVYVEGTTDVPVISAVMVAAGWGDDEFLILHKGGGKEVKRYFESRPINPLRFPEFLFLIQMESAL